MYETLPATARASSIGSALSRMFGKSHRIRAKRNQFGLLVPTLQCPQRHPLRDSLPSKDPLENELLLEPDLGILMSSPLGPMTT